MTAVSYLVIVDGCPIAFGSASCPTSFGAMTCAEDSDPTTSGFPTGHNVAAAWPTIVPASLMTGWSWSESLENVLQGELSVSALNFVLCDRPMTIEGTLRSRGVTWLGTRKSSRGSATIVNSGMSATIDASDLALDVDAGSLFGAGDQVVYVDREAILVDSRASNTFTINADGRGCYNSLAAIHTVNAALVGYKPRVWASFPGFDGRRVSLWQISAAGVATRRWTGYCSSAERNGTGYELVCEHAIVTERSRPVGVPIAAPRLRGYNTANSFVHLRFNGSSPSGGFSTASHVDNPSSGRVVNTKQEFFGRIVSVMTDLLAGATPVVDGYITLTSDGPDGQTRLYASATTVTELTAVLSIDGEQSSGVSTQTTDPHTVTVHGQPMPPVIVRVTGGELGQTPITSIVNLPASWLGVPRADGDMTTTLTPVMRGQLDSDHWAVIEPNQLAPSGPVVDNGTGSPELNPGAFLIGQSRIETRINYRDPRLNSLKTHVPAVLTPQILVTSPHWLLAMRRGFIEDATFANSGSDLRDWDWTDQDSVLRATQSSHAGMQLYLDGTATLDSKFRDRFKANACGIGIRGGKLSPIAFRAPLPTDAISQTYTSRQFARGTKPVWKRLRNALVNVVEVDCGRGLTIRVRDQQSAARYGFSAPMKLTMGLDEVTGAADLDPFEIIGEVTGRVIGTFGQPVSTVTFTLGPSRIDEIVHGQYIQLSDWLSPDGLGNVGLSGTVGQVIGRAPMNVGGSGESGVEVTLLLYGLDGLAGFAPALRAASLNVARDEIAADVAYLGVGVSGYTGATDYAGSNQLGYRYFSTFPNDGGVSWYVAGQVVRLVERNTTTPASPEVATILSVTPSSTPGSSLITFTGAVAAGWSAIAAAGNLDIVPAVYASSTIAQRQFCYIASSAAPYPIGGTADTAKVFA